MYNAIKSILKTKKLFVIAIVQLAVGISFLNYTNIVTSETADKNNTIKSLFLEENEYFFWANENGPVGENWINRAYKIVEKLEELKNQGIVENYGSYVTQTLYIPEFRAWFSDGSPEEEEKIRDYYMPILQISEMMFKKLEGIEVIEGRAPVKADFNKDYKKENIPIWIGKEHKDKIEIGQVIKSEGVQKENENERQIADINYEVVGVLDRNELPIIYEKILFGGTKVFLRFENTMILIPQIKDFSQHNVSFALDAPYGSVVRLTNNMYLPKFKKEIEEVSEMYKHEPFILETKEVVESVVGNLENELEQNIILGVVLTFLSVIGILSAMLGNVTRRYDEFGIKMSQGASIKDIIKEIFFEILLIVGFAIGLGNILLLYRKVEVEYTVGMALQNILVALGITLVILVPVVMKVKKLNIVDLIRGQ